MKESKLFFLTYFKKFIEQEEFPGENRMDNLKSLGVKPKETKGRH